MCMFGYVVNGIDCTVTYVVVWIECDDGDDSI